MFGTGCGPTTFGSPSHELSVMDRSNFVGGGQLGLILIQESSKNKLKTRVIGKKCDFFILMDI